MALGTAPFSSRRNFFFGSRTNSRSSKTKGERSSLKHTKSTLTETSLRTEKSPQTTAPRAPELQSSDNVLARKQNRSHSTLRATSSMPVKEKGKKGSTSTVKTRNPAFVVRLLTRAETASIVADCGELGVDPSSTQFAKRLKNIAFVISLNGQWFQINQNFFNQAEEYNDFSGGYRRFYEELPREFIQNKAAQKILTKYKALNKIEDGELILVQVQTSVISAEDEGKCLTGQGIHSDGADRAMLIVLERDNVKGAKSSVYEDVHGERPIVSPRVVKEGEVLFWKDNEIYHYVEPAELADKSQGEGRRTVMIAHYPAMQYITGEPNPNNTLPPSGFHPPHINHPKL